MNDSFVPNGRGSWYSFDSQKNVGTWTNGFYHDTIKVYPDIDLNGKERINGYQTHLTMMKIYGGYSGPIAAAHATGHYVDGLLEGLVTYKYERDIDSTYEGIFLHGQKHGRVKSTDISRNDIIYTYWYYTYDVYEFSVHNGAMTYSLLCYGRWATYEKYINSNPLNSMNNYEKISCCGVELESKYYVNDRNHDYLHTIGKSKCQRNIGIWRTIYKDGSIRAGSSIYYVDGRAFF